MIYIHIYIDIPFDWYLFDWFLGATYLNLCVLSRTTPQMTDPTIPQTTMVNPMRPALISSPLNMRKPFSIQKFEYRRKIISVKFEYYGEVEEDDLIEQRRHGVKNTHVKTVGNEQQHVTRIRYHPLNGLVVAGRCSGLCCWTWRCRRKRRRRLETCNKDVTATTWPINIFNYYQLTTTN